MEILRKEVNKKNTVKKLRIKNNNVNVLSNQQKAILEVNNMKKSPKILKWKLIKEVNRKNTVKHRGIRNNNVQELYKLEVLFYKLGVV